jgi:hypothetical protein
MVEERGFERVEVTRKRVLRGESKMKRNRCKSINTKRKPRRPR